MHVHWKRAYGLSAGATVVQVDVSRLRHLERCFSYWDEYDLADAKRYARLMRRGIRFPIMHTTKRKDGCLEVCDGNHRLYAVRRLGVKRVPVILWKK